jgi:hypothetical protein
MGHSVTQNVGAGSGRRMCSAPLGVSARATKQQGLSPQNAAGGLTAVRRCCATSAQNTSKTGASAPVASDPAASDPAAIDSAAVDSVVFCVANAGGFAREFAQVEQASTTHNAAGHNFNLIDTRRVREEYTLYADAEAHLAHSERGASAGAMTLQHHALENLNTILVAFNDFVVNAHSVANPKFRVPLAEVGSFEVVELLDGIHCGTLRRPHGVAWVVGRAV